MIISCFAVYQLVYFQAYVTRKTKSILVRGDSLHYLSDLLMNFGIILSLILSSYCVYVDAICGVGVGIYVLCSAVIIIRNALIDLMDEALPKPIRKKIEEIILNANGVIEIKSLRTRSAGMKKYIEAIVYVDQNISLKEANKIAKTVEDALSTIDEKVDVLIKTETKD